MTSARYLALAAAVAATLAAGCSDVDPGFYGSCKTSSDCGSGAWCKVEATEACPGALTAQRVTQGQCHRQVSSGTPCLDDDDCGEFGHCQDASCEALPVVCAEPPWPCPASCGGGTCDATCLCAECPAEVGADAGADHLSDGGADFAGDGGTELRSCVDPSAGVFVSQVSAQSASALGVMRCTGTNACLSDGATTCPGSSSTFCVDACTADQYGWASADPEEPLPSPGCTRVPMALDAGAFFYCCPCG